MIRQSGEARSVRIESMRAVAALSVVAAHVFALDYGWRGVFNGFGRRALMSGGAGGVFIFFMLTGYLLFWPFARRDFADGPPIRMAGYAANRALRILPLYYATIAGLVAVDLWMGPHRDVWRFALLLENFSTHTAETGDGPMWTLVLEIQFYALLPLLALGLARVSRRSVGAAALALAIIGVGSLAWRYSIDSAPGQHLLWDVSMANSACLFASGMLLALVRLQWERKPARRLPGWCLNSDAWMVAAIALWAVFAWQLTSAGFIPFLVAASFLAVGSCVLPLSRGRLMSVLEWRPLAVLGIASYSLYLLQVPIITRLAHTSLAQADLGGLALFALVTVPLCCAAALVSYAVVERPFLRMRRRWVGRSPTRQAPGRVMPARRRSPDLPATATSDDAAATR